jgi:hypothetical protein
MNTSCTVSGDHWYGYAGLGMLVLAVAILATVYAAGCTYSVKTPFSSGGSTPWTGTYDSNWGTLVITQNGNHADATYTYDEGRITGTVSGNTLTGTWSESPSYQPPDDAGDVVLTLSDDGNSIQGNWRYGSGKGTWDGDWTATRK